MGITVDERARRLADKLANAGFDTKEKILNLTRTDILNIKELTKSEVGMLLRRIDRIKVGSYTTLQ